MINKILLWLCRWSYRRLTLNYTRHDSTPTGIPGMRDPNAKCRQFAPRKKTLKDFPCGGDSHYLCKEECAYFVQGYDDELNDL